MTGRDSNRQYSGGHVESIINADADAWAGKYYGPILHSIEEAKRLVYSDMAKVAERFWEARKRAIEDEREQLTIGGKPQYVSLTLAVTIIKGTSIARWVDIHSKNGKKTGVVSRRSLKGTGNYHLANLKQGIPNRLHAAIEAAELELRNLRRYQRQISLAKRRLQEKPGAGGVLPPNLDEIDWSWATPPTEVAPPPNFDEIDWSWATPPAKSD